MNPLESCKFILRSLALAALATLLALIILEWIMPGSVLPFVNLVAFTLPLAFICLLLLVDTHWQSGVRNWIQTGLSLIVGLAILAFFASIVGYSSLSQLGLLGAGCLCLITWTYIQLNAEFHN